MKHKKFDFNLEKHEKLRAERGIDFNNIVYYLQHGGLIDTITHPNQEKHPGQQMLVVNVNNYAYMVPFVYADDDILFLKTIYPCRKATKKYLRRGKKHETINA